MRRRPIWIARLRVTSSVIAKLGSKHGLTIRQVEDAVACRKGLYARRDVDARGLRLLLEVTVGDTRLLVVLAETDEVDCYRLVTAHTIP